MKLHLVHGQTKHCIAQHSIPNCIVQVYWKWFVNNRIEESTKTENLVEIHH